MLVILVLFLLTPNEPSFTLSCYYYITNVMDT